MITSIRKIFAVTVLLTGFPVMGANLAFAAGIPDATATGAVSVSSSSATLNASIQPNGAQTEYWMEFGTSPSFERMTNRYLVSGTTGSISVSQTVTNLLPSTTYSYRVKAQNSHGTAVSNIRTFTTTTAPAPVDDTAMPEVIASSATNVSQNSATLNGSVDPNNLSTTYRFEYGIGNFSLSTPSFVVSGDGARSISAAITGLAANTAYSFRIVASNARGTSVSNIRTFTTTTAPAPVDDTAMPEVIASSATNVSQNSATLNGSVDPNNLSTTYRFEYGIGNFSLSTPSFVVSGDGARSISAAITGLAANTSYSFRIVASNARGTSVSNIRTFTTTTAPAPVPIGGAPTVSISPAHGITRNSATFYGYVNPNGVWSEYWFEYGTTIGNLSERTTRWSLSGTTWNTAVTTNVHSLVDNTTYYYRLVAQNSHGIAHSPTRSFTTSHGDRHFGPPRVLTNNATSVHDTSAILNAEVTPNNAETTVWFEYGYTGQSLNRSSSSMVYPALDSTRAVAISVSGLSRGTRYDFRAVARNTHGTVHGEIRSFTTSGRVLPQVGLPIISTGNVTNITRNTASLWANVNPQDSSTVLWFEYGISAFNLNLRSSGHTISPHTGARNYYNSVSGLQADTLYFYRGIAENASGISRGEVRFFRTLSGARPPVVPTEDLDVFLDSSLSNLEPRAGSTMDYVLTYRNASRNKITSAELKVTLPFESEYVDASTVPTSRIGHNLTFHVGDIQRGSQGAITIRVNIKDDAEAGSKLMFNSSLEFIDSARELQTVASFITATVREKEHAQFLASLSAFVSSILGNCLFLFSILLVIMLIIIIYLIVSRRKDRKAMTIAAVNAPQSQ